MDARRRSANVIGRGAVTVINVGFVMKFLIVATLVVQCCAHGRQRIYKSSSVAHPRLRRQASGNTTTTTGATATMTSNATTPMMTTLPGTTENLREIFIGRCYDYPCDYCTEEQASSYSCELMWEAFNSSFAYRGPCSTSPDGFAEYATMSYLTVPVDKTLFYSGTYQLATTVGSTNADFINIESTLMGIVVDSLVFCGQADSPGINYKECPPYAHCPNETVSSFWSKMSETFSSMARGDVTVILNGSNSDGAYRTTSAFRSVEVVHMNSTKVTSLTAYIVHDLDGNVFETCVTGSILELQQDMEVKGIKFNCEENPSITRNAQCLIEKDHPACLGLVCPGSSANLTLPTSLTMIIAFIVTFLVSTF